LAGDDVLTGGSGNDLFEFGDMSGGKTITDFEQGKDRIDLSALDADIFQGGVQVFTFHADGNPHANGLWATSDGSTTTVFGDSDGNIATIEFQLILTGFASPLSANDFIM
jgi:Ca2+-binding RTX toxin-like protein